MEVIEDTEPPFKRVKTLSGEVISVPGNSPVRDFIRCSLVDKMERPQTSQGGEDMLGPSGIIRKSEFIRVITSALYSLGLKKTGALLEEESGISLHSSVVKTFLQQVRDGKWDESLATLHLIGFSDENILKSVSFLLLEQKFFELLKLEKIKDALETLRKEIEPLKIDDTQIRDLTNSFIMGEVAQGSDDRSKLMEELQDLLPASLMIPEKRLEVLVEKALVYQRYSCVFHNTLETAMSLYSDHECDPHQIPSETVQILEAHKDEVWFLQFSHDGRYLASASKDRSAIIWEVKEDGEVVLKHTLLGHRAPVITVSWSPDDREILTCGVEEMIRRWDVDSGMFLQVYRKDGLGTVSCGWFPNGTTIFAAMLNRSICTWDLSGREIQLLIQSQTLPQISDMAMTDDGKWLVSVCNEVSKMLSYGETTADTLIEEEDMITSFSLSRDNKFLLVNLLNQKIHLWSLEDDEPRHVASYLGHRHSRFVIRSCFGGLEQAFIASGSEDSLVYIWDRRSTRTIMRLLGHSGSVNCVSWSPTNIHLLASGSDDHTIRIWGPAGSEDHQNRNKTSFPETEQLAALTVTDET